MAPDSLAPIVFGLDFREPALAEAEFEAEVEVCLDGDTGIDEARLVVEVSLALPGVEGVFVCH